MKTKKFIFPLVAAMIGIGAAFANSASPKATFNVSSEDATYFYVSASPLPNCGASGSAVCKITSSATPDGSNRILKTQATASAWRNP
jgi:hypothetical protein